MRTKFPRVRREARRRLRMEVLEHRLLLAGDLDDDMAEATSLGAASPTAVTHDELIIPDTDVDMYRFTVTAHQVVDIDIDTAINGPGGVDAYVRLFNSRGQQIASSDDAFAPGEDDLGFDPYLRYSFDSAGTYYVGVSNANNISYSAINGSGDVAGGPNATGSYTLILQALPSDADDSLSEAPSLGAISATPVTVAASITPDVDVDMYRFTVNANQVVDFDIDTTLNGPGGLGSYLRLFNSQGTQLAFNNDGMAPGENLLGYDAFLRHTFSSSGTYYLGVSNANNTEYSATTGSGDAAGGLHAIGDYQLTVRTAPTVPNDPDDEISEAAVLSSVTTTPKVVTASITPDVDVDMYRFSVAANTTVDFDIDTTINGRGGLGSYVRLFNAQGEELAENDDALAPGESELGFDAYLRHTFATAGTYYLGVSNANNATYNATSGTGDVSGGQHTTGEYTLTVLALPVDADDTISEATSLGSITSSPDVVSDALETDIDVDMYRFTVGSGQVVDFDIDTAENGSEGLGSYIRLFNSQGQQLAFNNDGAAPGELVVGFDAYLRHTFASSGTYYLGVSNVNNITYNASTGAGDTAGGLYSIGSYTLTVRTAPQNPVDDDDEISEATVLGAISTSPIEVDSAITPDVDVDMYRFTVEAGQIVDFDIDTPLNGPGGLGAYLRLFNSQGTQLASNNDGAAPGENEIGFDAYFRHTFTSRGTYYLGVSNWLNTEYDPRTGNGDTSGVAGAVGSYQLIVQALPDDLDDTLSEAKVLSAVTATPQTRADAIVTDVDVDMYRFTASAGQLVGFDIDTPLNGTGGLGSYLRLFDDEGQQLASNDNGAALDETELGIDAYLQYTFAKQGTYYLGVSNANNTQYNPLTGVGDTAGGDDSIGTYTLTVGEILAGNFTLNLSLNSTTLREDGGVATATLSRSGGDDSHSLVVQLASSDVSEALVPATVTIPANSSSTTFTIVGVDDTLLDGTQTAVISASATGYASTSVTVQVTDVETLTITLNAATMSEREGAVTGTVRRSNTDRDNALTVQLQSSDETEATVPAQVVIPAGQSTASFVVTAHDDALLDGPHTVTITASSTGYVTGSRSITVTDYERLTLTINPNSIGENGGTATGTVTRGNIDDHTPVTVLLSSSDTSEAVVPTTVTIPGTAASVTFTITGVDDAISDQAQYVVVTASAGGFVSGNAGLTVTDDEPPPPLTLMLSGDLLSENGGTLTGTVSRATSTSGSLVVLLTSSDVTEAVVPASVTIAAGASSANFTVAGVDDAESDGTQRVTITAHATGLPEASQVILVTDDELSYHNPEQPLDVSGDGIVSPLDALLVISILNNIGGGPAAEVMAQYEGPALFPDTNGDTFISPIDSLLVISFLNSAEAEGEQFAAPPLGCDSEPVNEASAIVQAEVMQPVLLSSSVEQISSDWLTGFPAADTQRTRLWAEETDWLNVGLEELLDDLVGDL